MRDEDDLFAALARSSFRRRFALGVREIDYFDARGLAALLGQADTFIEQRLAPADPANDGQQTPMRNHPVFVAQHATATCCRGCLSRWHGIARARPLDDDEKRHVRNVIERWLRAQHTSAQRDLFDD